MSLHHIYPNKFKKCHHRRISLAGTDHCNSKFSKKIIHFEKDFLFFPLNISENLQENQSPKGRILEGLRVLFNGLQIDWKLQQKMLLLIISLTN